jgi:hypothetical protein
MNITKIVFAISMMVSLCSGAIVQKEVTLSLGQGIDISTNQIAYVLNDSSSTGNITSHCDTLKRGGQDLAFFATGFWDDFVCGCGGQMLELLSSDTIAQIKKISSIDFNKVLQISDTISFSIASQRVCSLWTANCPDTQNSCSPCHPPKSYSIVWNLGKTHEGNYYLFRAVARHDAATINYMLQTDGSLIFNGVTVGVINDANRTGRLKTASDASLVKRFGIPSTHASLDQIYDIRGRRISAFGASGLPSRASMIFIMKKTNRRDFKNK